VDTQEGNYSCCKRLVKGQKKKFLVNSFPTSDFFKEFRQTISLYAVVVHRNFFPETRNVSARASRALLFFRRFSTLVTVENVEIRTDQQLQPECNECNKSTAKLTGRSGNKISADKIQFHLMMHHRTEYLATIFEKSCPLTPRIQIRRFPGREARNFHHCLPFERKWEKFLIARSHRLVDESIKLHGKCLDSTGPRNPYNWRSL